jgi:hypothetical protein
MLCTAPLDCAALYSISFRCTALLCTIYRYTARHSTALQHTVPANERYRDAQPVCFLGVFPTADLFPLRVKHTIQEKRSEERETCYYSLQLFYDDSSLLVTLLSYFLPP